MKFGWTIKRIQVIAGFLVIAISSTLAVNLFAPNPATEIVNGTIIVGQDRPVTVYLPESSQDQNPPGLLIDLHGYSGESLSQSQYTFLKDAAYQRGVIYAAPNGLIDQQGNHFWNASSSCCNFNNNPVDDTEYLNGIVEEISNKVAVDPNRIYLFGHSNGHFMTYKFACDKSEVVAAIAGLAGAMDVSGQSCNPSNPVSVLHIHGTADQVIAFDGGSIFGNAYTSAEETLKRWARFNGCQDDLLSNGNFNLLASISGDETDRKTYECTAAKKVSVETWIINQGAHSPELDLNFAFQVIDWLLEHQKQK